MGGKQIPESYVCILHYPLLLRVEKKKVGSEKGPANRQDGFLQEIAFPRHDVSGVVPGPPGQNPRTTNRGDSHDSQPTGHAKKSGQLSPMVAALDTTAPGSERAWATLGAF